MDTLNQNIFYLKNIRIWFALFEISFLYRFTRMFCSLTIINSGTDMKPANYK